jgi:GNAT superfamily N-acetyltransferase
MTVQLAQTPEDIAKCWEAIYALRPHLEKESFVSLIQELQTTGYHLAFIEKEGKAAAAVGYRYLHFLFCGKHIYIDDLTTLPEYRQHGFGSILLDFVHEEARKNGLKIVTLDSGHHRSDAHRLYLNKGYRISAHHFILNIK